MKKREACHVLGLSGIKELAKVLDVKYDSLRSMKRLSSMHIKLVRWEMDKQFMAEIMAASELTSDIGVRHLARRLKIDKLVAQGLADEEARANDSGLDN